MEFKGAAAEEVCFPPTFFMRLSVKNAVKKNVTVRRLVQVLFTAKPAANKARGTGMRSAHNKKLSAVWGLICYKSVVVECYFYIRFSTVFDM